MLFLLDTGVVAEFRKPKPQPAAVAWLSALAPDDVAIAAVTVGEIKAAIERTRRTDAARADELDRWLQGLCGEITVLTADGGVFRIWAKLTTGRPATSFADALVAATALHHGLTVATRQPASFLPFGVLVANPFGRSR